jgi:hypothetical protein
MPTMEFPQNLGSRIQANDQGPTTYCTTNVAVVVCTTLPAVAVTVTV